MDLYGIAKTRIETLVQAKESDDYLVYKQKRGNKKTNKKFSKYDENLIN